jgi:hypothetical protein
MKAPLKIFGVLFLLVGVGTSLLVAASTLSGVPDAFSISFLIARNLLAGAAGSLLFFALAAILDKLERI